MQIRVLAPCFNFELQNSIKAIKKPVFPTGSLFAGEIIFVFGRHYGYVFFILVSLL